MTSIKELLDEEKGAERQLKDAELEAESMLRVARATAAETLRKAQSDDALVKELADRNKERIDATKAAIQAECMKKAEETERLCRANLQVAVRVIVNEVLGVEVERRSA